MNFIQQLGYLAGLYSLTKQADKGRKAKARSRTYGHEQLGLQSNLPVGDKRELTPEEKALIEKEQQKMTAPWFPSYGTSIPGMMSSPAWGGVGGALGSGVLGAGAGAVLGGILGGSGRRGDFNASGAALGAGIGGLGLGALGGITGYYGKQQENADYEDIMRRLPEGATYRDYLSDPDIQRSADRSTMLAAASTPRLHGYGGYSALDYW